MTSEPPPRLWASGGFTLKIVSPRGAETIVLGQPHAVLGRASADGLTLDDPAVSSRHAYLHLDPRGLFVVDLATRTGTRVGPSGLASGWLRPGQFFEVAGRRIELIDAPLRGPDDDAPAAFGPGEPPSPLDDAGDRPLARLTLFPDDSPAEPLLLNSEFVFVGRSPACGVPVIGQSAMRVHCVLVRGRDSAFVVDLVGRGVWRNDRPVRGGEPLDDGDSLMVGSSRFQCRIEPPGGPPRAGLPAILGPTMTSASPLAMTVSPAGETILEGFASPPPLHLVPAEAQAAVLGWMMGQIQAKQDDAARRQSEFQTELVRLVAEIHRDSHGLLNRHLERADAIHKELSELREEIRKKFGENATPAPALEPPKPPPLKIQPAPPPESPQEAANWLIARVNQLDQENRKGWKDLLTRLSGRS